MSMCQRPLPISRSLNGACFTKWAKSPCPERTTERLCVRARDPSRHSVQIRPRVDAMCSPRGGHGVRDAPIWTRLQVEQCFYYRAYSITWPPPQACGGPARSRMSLCRACVRNRLSRFTKATSLCNSWLELRWLDRHKPLTKSSPTKPPLMA